MRKKAPKLSALTVEAPRGLSFVGHRVGKRLKVTGVTGQGRQGQIARDRSRSPR